MRILVFMLLSLVTSSGWAQADHAVEVWFGTAANPLGMKQGVYLARFSQDDQQITRPVLVQELDGAGWLSPSPTIPDVMYVTGDVDRKPSVLAINRTKRLCVQSIDDGGSCFLTTDNSGKLLLSAQYGGGSIAVFSVNGDGTIAARCQLVW